MAGFASYDDMISEMTTNGKSLDWSFMKVGSAMQGAGNWHRLWIASGSPGVGTEPATTPGAALTNDAASMNWANQSPDLKSLVTFGAVATQNCTLMLYDRLSAVGGLSSASTGAKTVNSAAIGRYTSGVGTQAWVEVTTASTTTQAVMAMNQYTSDVTTGRAGGNINWPAAATVKDCMIGPLPLQAGDKGVKSVEVGVNIVTANTAGVFNLVILKPLAYLPLIANQWNERDLVLQLASMPNIADGASLGLAILASSATAATVWGRVGVAYG